MRSSGAVLSCQLILQFSVLEDEIPYIAEYFSYTLVNMFSNVLYQADDLIFRVASGS